MTQEVILTLGLNYQAARRSMQILSRSDTFSLQTNDDRVLSPPRSPLVASIEQKKKKKRQEMEMSVGRANGHRRRHLHRRSTTIRAEHRRWLPSI